MSALEGRNGEPFRMVVEEGKVREFARATRSANPAYQQAGTPLSPATFLMSSAFWQHGDTAAWGDDPPDLRRALHGEQEFVFHGAPPRAGTELTGQQRIDRVYTKEGRRGGTMTFYELVTDYRDGDRLVAEARSTVIITSKPPSEEG